MQQCHAIFWSSYPSYYMILISANIIFLVTHLNTKNKMKNILSTSIIFISFSNMQTTKTIFFALVLLVLINSQISNENIYESELEYRQLSLQSTLQSIQKQVQFLRSNLEQFEETPMKQVVVLEDALADQRDVLLAMQANQTLPVKNVPCHKYSQDTIQFYNQELAKLEEETDAAGQDIEGIKKKVSPEMALEFSKKYDWISQYLQKMAQIVKSLKKCTSVEESLTPQQSFTIDVSKNIKINNLKAANWIYGTETLESLNLERFQQISANNVTMCSVDTPFVVEGQCAQCENIYDMSLKKCSQCPVGMVLHPENHQCEEEFHFCYSGKFYNANSGECQCPSYAPYFTGLGCVACYLPHFWNEDSKECSSCPAGSVFNLTKQSCQQCPSDKPYAVNLKCEKCNFTSFVWESSCASCPESQFYNRKENKCQYCEEGSIINKEQNACELCPESTPVSMKNYCISCPEGESYVKSLKKCIPCTDEQVFTEYKGVYKCVCPQEKPFFNGKSCLTCFRPQFWNQTALECQSCPPGFTYTIENSCVRCPLPTPLEVNSICVACPPNSLYSLKENKCNPCPSGKKLSSDLTYCKDVVCSVGATYNHQNQKCECSEDRPYDNGIQCIQCDADEEWNQEEFKCQGCEDSSAVNPATRKCEKCPEDKPFVRDGKCIGCPENSFYDQDKGLCLMCAEGSTYNEQQKRCEIEASQTVSETGKCSCPEGLIEIINPKLNKCECVKLVEPCQTGEFWNEVSQKCEKCPAEAVYREATFSCECPAEKPLLKEGQCQECPEGEQFDVIERQCIQ